MRKLFCLFFLFVTVFFSLPVYADSLVSSEELHFQCMNCSYTSSVGAITWVNDNAKMTCPECGGRLGVFQGETFIAGGGVTRGSGVGRPEGYTGEGVANYNTSGILQLVVDPLGFSSGSVNGVSSSAPTNYIVGSSGSGVSLPDGFGSSIYPLYSFTAPVDGLYYLGSLQGSYNFGVYSYFTDSKWNDVTFSKAYSSQYGLSGAVSAGATVYFTPYSYSFPYSYYTSYPYKYSFDSIIVFVEPLSGSSISSQTSITINDNAFNGNIYVDNSSNLTYIYPQYTTITEEGDTVTNISETVIVYNNTTNQYITYDQTTNNYYYITTDGNPPVVPTPTPEPTATPTPSPDPYEPIGVGDTQSYEVNGGTSLSGSVSAKAGDYILATVSARSDITIPDSMITLKIGDYVTASSGTKQAMSFAYEQVQQDGTYTYTFTQSSSVRMYLNLIVLSNIDGLQYSGDYHTVGNGSSSLSVPDKSSGDMLVWGCSAIVWPSVAPYGLWTTSPDDLFYVGLSTSTQARQANFIDFGSGSLSRTFTPANTSTDYVIDAVEIIPKTVEPDPTPTPDPGSDLEPTPTPAPGGGYDDTNLLDKLGLWFADVNLNLNLAIENLALNFNTAIENLSADFDVYIKDLSANFTAVIEELQLNFKLAIENLNLTIQNYFGGGSGGSGSGISTPETAEPSPTPEPTPPLLEEEEPADSFLVQWLRAVVEHIQELLEPVQAVGSVYSDFYSYLPAPWQSALLGVFALLLVFALWRIFHG